MNRPGVTKAQAQAQARQLRAAPGTNARVVPTAGGWRVYGGQRIAPGRVKRNQGNQRIAPGRAKRNQGNQGIRRGWKLFQERKDGTIGSLFINRKARVPVGEWVVSESHPTKGFKYRPYYHVMAEREAPHLSTTGRHANRRWFEVEMKGAREMTRPESQGGSWFLADEIRVVPGSKIKPS